MVLSFLEVKQAFQKVITLNVQQWQCYIMYCLQILRSRRNFFRDHKENLPAHEHLQQVKC